MKQSKRRAPKAPPVTHAGVRYEAVAGAKGRGFDQNGGVIAAVDEATDRELWTLVVYRVTYDPQGKEPDTQDVFITGLEIDPKGQTLTVTNEKGRRFAVRLADRTVQEL